MTTGPNRRLRFASSYSSIQRKPAPARAHDGRAMSATIYDLRGLRILTKKEVCALVPYTPQHIHRLEKAGRFPRRLQLGPNRVGWRLVDIERWINERAPAPATAPADADDHIPF